MEDRPPLARVTPEKKATVSSTISVVKDTASKRVGEQRAPIPPSKQLCEDFTSMLSELYPLLSCNVLFGAFLVMYTCRFQKRDSAFAGSSVPLTTATMRSYGRTLGLWRLSVTLDHHGPFTCPCRNGSDYPASRRWCQWEWVRNYMDFFPLNQSINQSINRSISQPINQSMIHWTCHMQHNWSSVL